VKKNAGATLTTMRCRFNGITAANARRIRRQLKSATGLVKRLLRDGTLLGKPFHSVGDSPADTFPAGGILECWTLALSGHGRWVLGQRAGPPQGCIGRSSILATRGVTIRIVGEGNWVAGHQISTVHVRHLWRMGVPPSYAAATHQQAS